jgi:flavin-dependent dehydrogenase
MGKYDVVIVGAGPIGAYTAYLLADKGFDVCLIEEKKEIGEDVICAGVINFIEDKLSDFHITIKNKIGIRPKRGLRICSRSQEIR